MRRQIEIKNKGRKYIKDCRVYWYYECPEFWQFFDNIDKNIKIIEAGCGGGVVSDELAGRDFTDIELMDIEDIRKKEFEDVMRMPFHKVDFNFDRMPFNNNSVDLVISTSVIEHLENQYHFVREIYRILKPGGKFIVSMPNGWNIISRLLFLKNGMIEGYRGTNKHISPITKDIFKFMMKDFKEISRFYNQRTNLGFKPFCYFKVKCPGTEFWGNKVCYLFEKSKNKI